ncbi:MAG: hypothetical protein P1U57_03805, partial [Oleibacter sp.]|nr:hypothetical protein [Thalassolituus sp.]
RDSISAEYVANGYDVLNGQGMVLFNVPREKTPAELIEYEKQQKQQKAAELRVKQQKNNDQNLQRLYANHADVERARLRQVEDLQAQIDTAKRRIEAQQESIRQLEQKAADFERREQPVPVNITDELNTSRIEVKLVETSNDKRRAAINTINKEYDEINYRLRVLRVYPRGTLPENVDETLIPKE